MGQTPAARSGAGIVGKSPDGGIAAIPIEVHPVACAQPVDKQRDKDGRSLPRVSTVQDARIAAMSQF